MMNPEFLFTAFIGTGASPWELMFVFVIILVLFGARALPDFARSFGKIMHDLRKASNEFKTQLMEVQDTVRQETREIESSIMQASKEIENEVNDAYNYENDPWHDEHMHDWDDPHASDPHANDPHGDDHFHDPHHPDYHPHHDPHHPDYRPELDADGSGSDKTNQDHPYADDDFDCPEDAANRAARTRIEKETPTREKSPGATGLINAVHDVADAVKDGKAVLENLSSKPDPTRETPPSLPSPEEESDAVVESMPREESEKAS